MTASSGHFPHHITEMWALYGVGTMIFVIRFAVRLRTTGIRGLGWDDLFALLAWIFYTADGITVDRAYHYGTNVDFTVAQYEAMSPEQIAEVSLGSKYELTAWYTYTTLIWCMKASMLCFYRRLTLGSFQAKLVKWLAVAVGLSYISVIIIISAGCRPFHQNWQVWPQPDIMTCAFRMQNIISNSSLNIATDVAILAIPVPLLWRLQVAKKQKIVIALFLLTGVVVIIAATIRITVTLGSNPSTTTINAWGVRETIIGILCVNIPVLRPLFSGKFWRDGVSSSKGTHPTKKTGTKPDIEEGSQDYILADKVHVQVEVRMDNQERGDVELGNSVNTFQK
ncbi:Hypothetical protein D9617_18g032610 [Elsinoe fawcettii]|nr:Hypothetical protein D9617_18g032610 [Elsinoe fawcettii]